MRKYSVLSLVLLIFAGCSSAPIKEYKKKHFIKSYTSEKSSHEVFELLKTKMTKCYKQYKDNMVNERTIAEENPEAKSGVIYYQVDANMAKKILFYIDVFEQENKTQIKLYAEGDLFRPAWRLKQNISKWLAGKKAYCRGFGNI